MRIGHWPPNLLLAGVLALLAAPLTAASGADPRGGTAPSITEQVLYKFCSQSNCADGQSPQAGLIMDGSGKIYGTTASGGANNAGVAFKLSPTSAGWTYSVLYSFCSQRLCADGGIPQAGLIIDGAGNLYGTTTGGGPNQSTSGVIFKLAPSGSSWTETVLYSFCAQSNCADGAQPYGALIMDGSGNFYGTTSAGANSACNSGVGCGAVFELSPVGSGWTQKILYRFGSQSNCADGNRPLAGLVMDRGGNLYGTTYGSGVNVISCGGLGNVFELIPSGSSWTEKVLHSFTAGAGDGFSPEAGLIIDGSGNLYGTTFHGGSGGFGSCAGGCGAVFELSPTGSTWSENILDGFPSHSDGVFPAAGLIMDAAGHLYGTTSRGGGNGVCPFEGANFGCGEAFELAFIGTSWTYTALHVFCSQSNCADGGEPVAGLIMDGAGNLYGTASLGGTNNGGVVFALTAASNTLSVSEFGPGAVTSSPAGINCPGTCSASFASGTNVTLSESPAGGWNFLQWDGACAGPGGCAVTMNANRSVMATFWTNGSSVTAAAPALGLNAASPAAP